MGLLQQLGGGQGYLKAGFLGFPKSGKTWTAMLLACGVREFFSLAGPIAIFDTEGGAEYVAPEIRRRTGMEPVGIRSRKFDDLVGVAREAEADGISVLIVDSVTHVWRELCDAYLIQINEARQRKAERGGVPFSPQKRLEFQDWNTIKPKWATWTDLYLNSQLHIIICGRAGYEYDFEERDDDSGKKDLVKTGIKMKTESEFGFEPSLLVQMERVQSAERGRFTGAISHHATVLGDRFSVIDGHEADNPDFEFFRPHVAMLTPGAHAPIDVRPGTDMGVSEDGDTWAKEKRQRAIYCEEIQGELLRAWPGQTAVEKKAKAEAIEAAFSTRSWTKVEGLPSDSLREGLTTIRALVNVAAAPSSDTENKEIA